MRSSYVPHGVCSTLIEFDISDDNTLNELKVTNGCSGNLQGISKLCKGRNIDEIIDDLKGIKCGFKNTSCPDQISKALIEYKEKQKN